MLMRQQSEAGLVLPKGGDVTLPRRTLEENSKRMPVIPGLQVDQRETKGVPFEIVTLGASRSEQIVFYIHGGAWAAGNAESSRGFASLLAADLGVRVATVSYRLAPENKYPSQLDDCMAVYDSLAAENPDSKIALIGESAGAHLCLALTHRLHAEGKKPPICVTLYSPMVDCTGALREAREKNRESDIVVGGSGIVLDDLANELCFGACDANTPTVSPLQGDFTDFPPLCVEADESEMLYADYLALKEKAEADGVPLTAKSWPDCFHAFPSMGRACPESTEAYEMSIDFMKKQLDA